GRAAPLLRADFALRGLYLPAGRHEVELVFDPPGFALGQEWANRALAVAWILVALRLLIAAGLLLGRARRPGGILARRSVRRRPRPIEGLQPREEPTGAR